MTDARDIAITILALVRAERYTLSPLVQRLLAELRRLQQSNGSWNDELWDTTWAISAFNATGGAEDRDVIDQGVRFVLSTQDAHDGTWYEEPWETMLALNVLFFEKREVELRESRRAVSWLAGLQRQDGCIVGTRYTGMALSLFTKLERTELAAPALVSRAEAFLREQLRHRPIWTGAAWSNYYGLVALLDRGATLADADVARAVTWFVEAQSSDGAWNQVSIVHDTAMSVLALAEVLSEPLIDVAPPRVGVLSASRENGHVRVSYHPPGAGALAPADRIRVAEDVRDELRGTQEKVFAAIGSVRTRGPAMLTAPNFGVQELQKSGRFAYGRLMPARIQAVLDASYPDHVRLDVDERLIDLPWELAHDGTDFLCMRYAIGRRILSESSGPFVGRERSSRGIRALVVANPTNDLPASEEEGARVAARLGENPTAHVDLFVGEQMSKRDFLINADTYDIIHFAGHAQSAAQNGEACLEFSDGRLEAFELSGFMRRRAPRVVFLNSCWSADETADPAMPMVIRGLGRTLMYAGVTAFLGYLVPVPDLTARTFAEEFYRALVGGQSIGESTRRARVAVRRTSPPQDLTWAAAVLYGDPAETLSDPVA